MTIKELLAGIIVFSISTSTYTYCQESKFTFSASVEIGDEVKNEFKSDGRLYLFLSENFQGEPRRQTWPRPVDKTHIFAKNLDGLSTDETLKLEHDINWVSTIDWNLSQVPAGEYNVQIVWDQDQNESGIDAPGNLYSEPQKVNLNQSTKIDILINQSIEQRKFVTHNLSKEIDIKSEVLTNWWNKPMHLKASVLLPHNYSSKKAYPIRYNVAGYGGRYTRINNLLEDEDFMTWWDSDEAPQIINVFLDGEGPFGDSYQMDSENNGPYGEALINELVPHIESKYRGTSSADTRFVDGCSTGGWVSLGLQLYYPDFFNGAFSYSPDPIEFENFFLINIYEDENVFVNEFNYKRPLMRNKQSEPILSWEDLVRYENILGTSNTYVNSGGPVGAYMALYSPKGENGLPKPLFDPITGEIDHEVAEHWEKYDFKRYAKQNWEELGPKIQGKIYIWMGDMDRYYLNLATRSFDAFLKGTQNPKSDAEIVFSPMEGHCSLFSHKEVLLQIQERLESLGD